jgi:hypothetical protein
MIREKRTLIRNEAKMKKSLKNRAVIPRTATRKKLTDMEDHLDSLGLDTTSIGARARSQSRGRSQLRSRTGTEDVMDVDSPDYEAKMRAKSRARSQSNRRDDGVTNEVARTKAERAQKLSQRKMNRMARQGEADRHVAAAMPKHLVRSFPFPTVSLTSLTDYSSLASEAWARRIVVSSCISQNQKFISCSGVWEHRQTKKGYGKYSSRSMFGVVVFFLAREGFSLPCRDPEPEIDALKSLHISQVRLLLLICEVMNQSCSEVFRRSFKTTIDQVFFPHLAKNRKMLRYVYKTNIAAV